MDHPQHCLVFTCEMAVSEFQPLEPQVSQSSPMNAPAPAELLELFSLESQRLVSDRMTVLV